MIETHRLENVVIFIQAILSFVLSRKILNIYDSKIVLRLEIGHTKNHPARSFYCNENEVNSYASSVYIIKYVYKIFFITFLNTASTFFSKYYKIHLNNFLNYF